MSPGTAGKAWITGTSPVMTTVISAESIVYTGVLGNGRAWAYPASHETLHFTR
jgi:hypothetical protein